MFVVEAARIHGSWDFSLEALCCQVAMRPRELELSLWVEGKRKEEQTKQWYWVLAGEDEGAPAASAKSQISPIFISSWYQFLSMKKVSAPLYLLTHSLVFDDIKYKSSHELPCLKLSNVFPLLFGWNPDFYSPQGEWMHRLPSILGWLWCLWCDDSYNGDSPRKSKMWPPGSVTLAPSLISSCAHPLTWQQVCWPPSMAVFAVPWGIVPAFSHHFHRNLYFIFAHFHHHTCYKL